MLGHPVYRYNWTQETFLWSMTDFYWNTLYLRNDYSYNCHLCSIHSVCRLHKNSVASSNSTYIFFKKNKQIYSFLRCTLMWLKIFWDIIYILILHRYRVYVRNRAVRSRKQKKKQTYIFLMCKRQRDKQKLM